MLQSLSKVQTRTQLGAIRSVHVQCQWPKYRNVFFKNSQRYKSHTHYVHLYKRFCYFSAVLSGKKQLNSNLCNSWHALRTVMQAFLDATQNIIHAL